MALLDMGLDCKDGTTPGQKLSIASHHTYIIHLL
jgi:hypothetical protein